MSLDNAVTVDERFSAPDLGGEALRFIKQLNFHHLDRKVDRDAIALIKEIKAILDDRTLDDPDCFQRIDAIVRAFHKYDIPTDRHWELE